VAETKKVCLVMSESLETVKNNQEIPLPADRRKVECEITIQMCSYRKIK
jgi:hypothetical protein